MKKEINEIILNTCTWLDEKHIREEARLELDLGFDCLDSVELLMALEKHYDLHIKDEEWEEVERVGDIYKLIEKKV